MTAKITLNPSYYDKPVVLRIEVEPSKTLDDVMAIARTEGNGRTDGRPTEHIHTHTHSLADDIGDADQKTLVPAIRGRISRIRWLYRYVEEQGSLGVSSETIRSVMMAGFGLTARTVNDYIETLASQRYIVKKLGVWVSLTNSLP